MTKSSNEKQEATHRVLFVSQQPLLKPVAKCFSLNGFSLALRDLWKKKSLPPEKLFISSKAY